MLDVRPLRLSTHAELRWTKNTNFGFASDVLMLPVAIEELASAAVSFPLAFVDTSSPALVAMTGLRAGQNLFVGPDNRWLGDYLPAVLRGYPFKLLQADDGRWALGFDHASGLITDDFDADRFFTVEGKPAESVQESFNFLLRLNAGLERSAKAVALLQERGLIEPWPLKLRDGQAEVPIAGLSRVNENKLAELDVEAFASLRENGVLALAYSQLISMANIEKLGKLARLQAQHSARAARQEDQIRSMFAADGAEDEIDWDAMLKDN